MQRRKRSTLITFIQMKKVAVVGCYNNIRNYPTSVVGHSSVISSQLLKSCAVAIANLRLLLWDAIVTLEIIQQVSSDFQ
jgi:hypothetical protein